MPDKGTQRRAKGKRYDDRHKGRATLYNSTAWRSARAAHLATHPTCQQCRKEGRTTSGKDVDHIIPHRGDLARFWDRGNWQTLCKGCHTRKTRRGE
jgi:5-methylcytosine-specific restriction protein A